MGEPVTFYLEDGLRQSAEAGRHNFIARLVAVLTAAGMRAVFRPDTAAERALARSREGRSMFHMADPVGERALTFRRAYHYPFWQIERTAARWDWDVARARFDGVRERRRAEAFHARWRDRLFGEAAAASRRGGMIYVPLQGLIRQHRSFQTMSPIDMVAATLERAEGRSVLVGLHPKETYGDAERQALASLCAGRAEIVTGGMERALAECALVVTQNSSAAFDGYFLGKPAVLFAGIDFHHIAARVADLGTDGAFERAATAQPDYAGYVWWFWQRMSINAGLPDAESRIALRLRALRWPV